MTNLEREMRKLSYGVSIDSLKHALHYFENYSFEFAIKKLREYIASKEAESNKFNVNESLNDEQEHA